MIKADKYLKETIQEILESGNKDVNPRPKWQDGTPAHTKFVTQKVFEYNIANGDFPITTLRPTALKGAFHDIEAIYLKQTNVLEEMHPSIKTWWQDFTREEVEYAVEDVSGYTDINLLESTLKFFKNFDLKEVLTGKRRNILGQTYGNTVKRYDLMNKLLKGLEENPFGRRHIISMWQEQQMIDDPKSLTPCAYETLWSVREEEWKYFGKHATYSGVIFDFSSDTPPKPVMIRYLDITLMQRSMDFVVTSSINPAQYCMLAMMVANHLTFKTGIKHEVGKMLHIVQNCHIYDRHFNGAKEILERESTGLQPKIELICEPKDFYSHIVEDFKFTNLEGIKPLSEKLEIAI